MTEVLISNEATVEWKVALREDADTRATKEKIRWAAALAGVSVEEGISVKARLVSESDGTQWPFTAEDFETMKRHGAGFWETHCPRGQKRSATLRNFLEC
jgi:hypothetical protein